MVSVLMMSAKITTPRLLKIRAFWKNGYDVIISVHDITIKVLSLDSNQVICDQSLVTVAFLWEKLS